MNIEQLQKELQDTEIIYDEVHCILACSKIDDGNRVMVNKDELTWLQWDEEYATLSLETITNQLQELGYNMPFYVWKESGLSGKIYQYGNHIPPQWEEHGTTKGYA